MELQRLAQKRRAWISTRFPCSGKITHAATGWKPSPRQEGEKPAEARDGWEQAPAGLVGGPFFGPSAEALIPFALNNNEIMIAKITIT
jgi:hypothetical protein